MRALTAPAELRRRVYIIDEVHMLSPHAFNALLKLIEEPPDHVVFILATTDTHRVPPTIISRTQRHDFRRLPTDVIAAKLTRISTAEGIAADPEALDLIARLADGGMRDVALDQPWLTPRPRGGHPSARRSASRRAIGGRLMPGRRGAGPPCIADLSDSAAPGRLQQLEGADAAWQGDPDLAAAGRHSPGHRRGRHDRRPDAERSTSSSTIDASGPPVPRSSRPAAGTGSPPGPAAVRRDCHPPHRQPAAVAAGR
jgi:hypothetical protein